jgi:4-hydroxybenzoate polyprenyltransferase
MRVDNRLPGAFWNKFTRQASLVHAGFPAEADGAAGAVRDPGGPAMIRRWGRYVRVAYRPSVHIPYMVSWAVGLTALFAAVTGSVTRWRPGAALVITVVTLVVNMLLMRALDDIRDAGYDRKFNPGRPLPSGLVRERDLVTMVAIGSALLLLMNAGRGVVLVMLAVQMTYTAAVIAADRLAGWPHPDRLGLQLVVNLPIQALLSLYVYVGFLHAEHLGPSLPGFIAVLAVTMGALCMELGRKATRRPRSGERTYVTVLGPSGTSLTALAAAVAATLIVLVTLAPAPWQPGGGWGWLVLAPLALPALAVARFAAGAIRWPVALTLAYIPVMYTSFLAVGWLTKGTFA